MDWIKCIKTFHYVVEENSFVGAAGKLGSTPPVVTKRIAWLERELQAQLLRRNTRRVSTTEAGKLLYARSKPVVNLFEDIRLEVSSTNDEPQGTVRLGAPIGFGTTIIMHILCEFLLEYPKIDVDLVWSQDKTDMLQNQIDIVITHDAPLYKTKAITLEPLGSMSREIYAAPTYLEKFGTPKKPEDLKDHNCLYNRMLPSASQWQLNEKSVNITGNFTCTEQTSLKSAAVSGIGLILMSSKAIPEELKSGALVRVLKSYKSPAIDVHLGYLNTSFLPKSHRALLEFIKGRGLEIIRSMP